MLNSNLVGCRSLHSNRHCVTQKGSKKHRYKVSKNLPIDIHFVPVTGANEQEWGCSELVRGSLRSNFNVRGLVVVSRDAHSFFVAYIFLLESS